VLKLTWADIYERLKQAPPGKLYGIPRGGQIVAGLTGRAVDTPEEADVIVDDIIDSGATKDRWQAKYPGKFFWSLVDKRSLANLSEWVEFPWESADSTAGPTDNVIRLLEFVGEDPNREGLRETPKRVCKALTEMTAGYKDDPALILAADFDSEGYDQMIWLRDIDFYSMCEHHMLPFHGTAVVGYIPDKRVVGLSKLARLVDCFARRLQIQERLTRQIAEALNDKLKPVGYGVVIRAHHMCMSCRGVRKPNAEMVTSALGGAIKDKDAARAEFMKLALP
jgi:GTP cyclohydrolase I